MNGAFCVSSLCSIFFGCISAVSLFFFFLLFYCFMDGEGFVGGRVMWFVSRCFVTSGVWCSRVWCFGTLH